MALCLVYTNMTAWAMLRAEDTRILILTYHRVVEVVPPKRERRVPYVLSRDFEGQLRTLKKRGYRSISLAELDEWFSRRHGRTAPPKRVVIITFDDGWRDNYTVAFPLLVRYGFRATFFLIADKVGKRGYMSLSEIQEMRRAGMEFGSHTLTHPRLTLMREEEAWREVYESKLILERLLGEKISTFSYPYGDYNKKIEDMARRAGYTFACSSEFGDNGAKAEGFRLKRLLIARNGPLSRFELSIATDPWLTPIRQGVYWVASTRGVKYAIRRTLPATGVPGEHEVR